MAARRSRYDWFSELEMKHHLKAIFLAHHADDQIETFFIKLLRIYSDYNKFFIFNFRNLVKVWWSFQKYDKLLLYPFIKSFEVGFIV